METNNTSSVKTATPIEVEVILPDIAKLKEALIELKNIKKSHPEVIAKIRVQ